MIALKRDRTSIPVGFRGKNRQKKQLALLKAVRAGTSKDYFGKAPWKTAKNQLKKESAGKCAYCDAPTDVVAHGDVEHFRPKSQWWWLACCYDNYLFSCQICNQSFKSDHFPFGGSQAREPKVTPEMSDAQLEMLVDHLAPDPLADPSSPDSGLALADFNKSCKKEKALLINPYEEDPESMLAYEVREATYEIRVVSKLPKFQSRVEACEKFYGLNRESLCRERWKVYEPLHLLKSAWDSLGAGERQALVPIISLAVAGDRPFAGMARHFVHTVWRIGG